MAIAKSAIGPTFNASVAAWLNEPWDPATLNKEGPRVAVVAADNVTDTVEPTPTVSGDCGEMLIPAGRPLIATLTFPDNPCTPVIVTLSGVLPPCANDTAVGLAAIVKSPEGVGSLLVAGLCVLVQLASVSSAMSRKTKLASRFGAVMKKFLLRHREDRALSAFLSGLHTRMPGTSPLGRATTSPFGDCLSRFMLLLGPASIFWLHSTTGCRERRTIRPLISSPFSLPMG
jgi:hypothetical protein